MNLVHMISLLKNSLRATEVFKTDAISYFFSNIHIHLISNSMRNRNCFHLSRLCAGNYVVFSAIFIFEGNSFQNKLRDLYKFEVDKLYIPNEVLTKFFIFSILKKILIHAYFTIKKMNEKAPTRINEHTQPKAGRLQTYYICFSV